jgi:hypothetical protein
LAVKLHNSPGPQSPNYYFTQYGFEQLFRQNRARGHHYGMWMHVDIIRARGENVAVQDAEKGPVLVRRAPKQLVLNIKNTITAEAPAPALRAPHSCIALHPCTFMRAFWCNLHFYHPAVFHHVLAPPKVDPWYRD